MNWRKLVAECQELKVWLNDHGYEDTDRILLKVLVLVLRGHLPPGAIVARAIALDSLQEAARDCSDLQIELDLPDKIGEIISKWLYCLPRDAWLLGQIHERLAVSRRLQGLFYTAPEVIDFIMAHTVETADIKANPYIKVLDPACGCGYFLLKAYDILWRKFQQSKEYLAARYPELDWSDAGIHRHIITHNLWGADIDSVAADIAIAGLLLKRPADSKNLRTNFLVCDSLRRSSENGTGEDRAFWSANYHYVVGNPPYLSFGLRGAKRLDPDYEGYLRQAYKASAEYKLSYYVLFMQRGIEILAQGGRLGFIVPDSFLLGRYYSKIRQYILANTAIELIAHIATPVFKNAAVGMSAICVLTKEADPLARLSQHITIYQATEKENLRSEMERCQYSQSYYATLPYNRFRIFSDLTVKNLIDKIDDSSVPLVNFASGHSGIRSVTKQSDILANEPASETWQRGLVSGSQVQRYGLVYSGHWLNIHPQALYKGGWNPAVVKQRKILVRQTGYTLVACIDEDGYYHLNNLHSFVLRNDAVSLDYLLLLLNSRLLSFYYHAVTMEFGRAMAQTDIDTLELLPVRLEAEACAQAPGLVGLMQSLVKRQLAGEDGLDKKIAALDDLMDQLVYRIYSLSDAEVACVERYEAKLAARRRQSRSRKDKGR